MKSCKHTSGGEKGRKHCGNVSEHDTIQHCGFSNQQAHICTGDRVFKDVEKWVEIRRRVLNKEISKRQACRDYKVPWRTLERILEYVEPPGYQLKQPRSKRKLDPFLPIIHEILEQDRQAPRKQRHTAQRIFDRLVSEHD